MIERFTSASLAALAKQTVRSHEFQRELLRTARMPDPGPFLACVETALQIGGEFIEGKQEMQLPNIPFCEREFNDLPREQMRRMADLWPDLEKRDASDPGVWARVNFRMVAEGWIKPVFFAGGQNGGGNATGAYRIDKALSEKDGKEGKKAIDGCARRIVRSFAGCPQIRGIRTLYQDCSPARAWWVCHLVDEAAREIARDGDAVLCILQQKAVWENLSERIVSSLTVVGDNKIRNGIILFLTDSRDNQDDARFLKGDDLKRLFRRIGQMCAWRALGYFDSDGVTKIIRDEIVPTIPPRS